MTEEIVLIIQPSLTQFQQLLSPDQGHGGSEAYHRKIGDNGWDTSVLQGTMHTYSHLWVSWS